MARIRGRWCATAIVTGWTLFSMALMTPVSLGAGGHTFDPVLSLEGGCEGRDGVDDPGCPYPAPPAGPQPLAAPCGAASDPSGDVYIATPTETNAGRVDVFNAQGEFITEFGNEYGPCRIAADSRGDIYVVETLSHSGGVYRIDRYEPDSYPLTDGIHYTLGGFFEFNPKGFGCVVPSSVAIDPSNDHLYVGHSCRVEEYGSSEEGNPLLKCCIGEGPGVVNMGSIDVYGGTHDVYATQVGEVFAKRPTSVFIFSGETGNKVCQLDGTGTGPDEEKFDFEIGGALGVDQSSGDLYVYDIVPGKIDRFIDVGGDCPEFADLDPDLTELPKAPGVRSEYVDLMVDAPCFGGATSDQPCNVGGEYNSPNDGTVYITVGTTKNNSQLYAFRKKAEGPPEIRAQTAVEIGEGEAVLKAEINPRAFKTNYRFEYVRQADFNEDGYASATSIPVSGASAGSGGAFVPVVESISGLEPDTVYHFRLVATNEECTTTGEGLDKGPYKPCGEGPDSNFSTYPTPPSPPPCSNAILRTGRSARLPDCRAYELVTPPDTNGRIPTMEMLGEGFGGVGFDTRLMSPSGESAVFSSPRGALPGLGGGGFADSYEALRQPGEGWQSHFTGLTASQNSTPMVGGISDDHRYAFWNVRGRGTLESSLPGENGEANYVRVPQGSPATSPNCHPEAEPEGRFEWIGCGSLGFEPRAHGRWIGPAGRIVFETDPNNSAPARQLETCAPPAGISAVYERTPGGPTRCVSLLPGNLTAVGGARYLDASADGSAIAFYSGGAIYVRRNSSETIEVAGGAVSFGGISTDGNRVVYVSGGNVFACDLESGGCAGEGAHVPLEVGFGGESVLVNVSLDGSHVYFISKAVLSGDEENGQALKATAGLENLYVWDGSAVHFISSLDPIDVSGQEGFGGLGLWVNDAFNSGTTTGPANDPSRTTPDGSVLVFESRADLTGYATGEHREVYRYDANAAFPVQLRCLSCNPTGAVATADALLESRAPVSLAQPFPPVNSLAHIDNVNVDGTRVFFQSAERLVAGDADEKIDVYEWEAFGSGGCERGAGCISLISFGQSAGDDYLYAMTPDGHDVLFLSGDKLLHRDPDGTPSIYDARVDGGVPEEEGGLKPCLGDACQPVVPPPEDMTPATLGGKPGNRGCAKRNSRKSSRRAKVSCAKTKRHHRPRHRHGTKGRRGGP